MISHSWRCVFIHQRKCAGTSIKLAFDLSRDDANWHTLNDGIQDPDFVSRLPGYLVFAVCRNPWDRFVSGWKYCASTRKRSLRSVLIDPPASGHDWRHLTRAQHETLYDTQGRPAFDVLLRYETLQLDFDALCDRLGKPRCTLARHNAGAHDDYRAYFDPETRALLARRYARDIELFDYSFDPHRRAVPERTRAIPAAMT